MCDELFRESAPPTPAYQRHQLPMSSSLIAVFDQAQSRLPDALRAAVNDAWHVLREELLTRPPADTEKLLAVLPKALAASEFVSRTCQQQPQLLCELLSSGELVRGYKVGEIRRHVQHVVETCADETALKQALRRLRLREMLRLALRDLAGWADLHEVVFTLTELADACVDGALQKSYQWATEKHGTPRGATSGEPQQLVVLGLGKLGGGELNFSSDIDLIFCYPEEGELQRATSGDGLSNHEFFVRLGQTLIAVLNEATADGFVFRVDMRLRPNGASGPLALSFDAMEQYYQLHGRDWERYAFVKARAIAGVIAAGERLLKDL
ncbi:MAG: hypothetical protein JSU71_00200 [Betaproteobacteria bacterium]|nr:MAG: hypothetical protein JSU71_00200 [Betaproteobacteria bacterium]